MNLIKAAAAECSAAAAFCVLRYFCYAKSKFVLGRNAKRVSRRFVENDTPLPPPASSQPPIFHEKIEMFVIFSEIPKKLLHFLLRQGWMFHETGLAIIENRLRKSTQFALRSVDGNWRIQYHEASRGGRDASHTSEETT